MAYENWMMNPMTQMGLGILSANRPGTSFGQALGAGMLSGMQNLQLLQEAKQTAEARKLNMERLRAQMKQAERDAQLNAQIRSQYQEYLGTLPENIRMEAQFLEPSEFPSYAAGRRKEETGKEQFEREMGMDMRRLGLQQRRLAMESAGVSNIQNAALPDGTTTLARENNRTGQAEVLVGPGQWAPAPAGTRFFGTQATGTAEEVGVGLTGASKTAHQARMTAAKDVVNLSDRFLELAKPENFGWVGSVRGTYQNARSQLGATANWADSAARDAKKAKVKTGEKWTPEEWFDTSLPAQDFVLNTLAYAIARQRDPSGRVSDMDVLNARQSLDATGGLSNINAVGARVNEARLSAVGHYNQSAKELGREPFREPREDEDQDLLNMMGL
jgi:hypothetical protein